MHTRGTFPPTYGRTHTAAPSLRSAAAALLFIFIPLLFFHTGAVHAVECFADIEDGDKKALRKALETCQEQIEETEHVLREQQVNRTSTEYDILLIDQEINKALLRIRSSDSIISELGGEIANKEDFITQLNDELTEQQDFLSELLQRINEAERRGFLSIILSDLTVSSFFLNTNEYESLREAMENSIRRITTLRFRLNASINDLEDKKKEQGRVRQQQRAAANQVQYQKNQKKIILDYQLGEERKTERLKSELEAQKAQIRTRLFEFSGGGAIPFESALAIAQEVESRIGIRPAFLLGLIKHESDLGKNVGTGSYRTDMHPTRDQPIFPYITKLLGFDPDEMRVSANPGFGWGGAMGPAQFIPSTWVQFGGFVNTRTGGFRFVPDTVIRTKATLQRGSTGSDVKRLQQFLNRNGFIVSPGGAGSRGKETTRYDDNTARAVSKFQERYAERILHPYGYRRGTGTVGPATRSAINQINFYSGPWQYRAEKDLVRKQTRSGLPSNPWNPRDAFFASGLYLSQLGAKRDECNAAASYYAGAGWKSSRYRRHAQNYCQAVLSNARLFQRDIDYLER